MMTQPGLECPQCGKHSLIQRTNDIYVCLNCNFKKDFAAPPPQKFKWGSLSPLLVLAVLLLIAHSFRLPSESPTVPLQSNPSRPTDSSTR